MTSVKMSIPYFVSVILIFCFTLSTFPTSNGEPVNCETQNKTTCCDYAECAYINCTNANEVTTFHEGCHAKVNLTKLEGICKKDTVKTICSGPAADTCSLVKTETDCCNTTANAGCAWLGACGNKTMKLNACYNATDLPKRCNNEYTDSCQTSAATPVVPTGAATPVVPTGAATPVVPTGTCKSFIKKEDCCNVTITKSSDCIFYECKNKTDPTKTITGCHNVSDSAEINKTCDRTQTFDQTCAATPVVPTVSCRNFTTNVTECCKHVDLGCVFVKCTGKAKAPFDGCYNKTEVTCPKLDDQCQAHTTEAPTTTPKPTTVKPTPEPVFEECQNLKKLKDCCGNELFKCIFVNCNGTTTKLTYKGCYSTTNQTTIQTECGTTFLDSCAAVAPTTAAPSTDRHFDGASFIGGIVLCAGIILIIFFVLKWYKSRQASSNYHQM